VLAAHLQQGRLGGADGGISRCAGHGGTAEELRTEVLHGDDVVVADDLLRPLAAGVLPLPGDLLVRLGPQLLRFAVALRCGPAFLRFAAGRHPVVAGQLGLGLLAVLGVREVVGVAGGGRGLLDAPVDPDHRTGLWERLELGGNDERAVPVAEAVAVHPRRGRFGR
jgi:hypothetical protein